MHRGMGRKLGSRCVATIDVSCGNQVMSMPELVKYAGGCHCGRVRFEVDAPTRPLLQACTCSICRLTGFVHLIVPAAHFRLLRGDDALVEYRFNTGVARHLFCRVCGVKSFYVPRSHPHGFSVNARCLDGDVLSQGEWLAPFDDADRDAATAAIAHLAD